MSNTNSHDRSERLTAISSVFHGYKFYVKPSPLNANEQIDEVDDMIDKWEQQNLTEEQLKDLQELREDPTKVKDPSKLKLWTKDIDFRSRYFKALMNTCVEWEDGIEPNDEVWRKDDIARGLINDVVAFFCGARNAPL